MGNDPKMRGPFTRKGSRVYRGDGALFVTVMSAAEGDMLLSLLNAPAPTDALKDEREAFEAAFVARYHMGYASDDPEREHHAFREGFSAAWQARATTRQTIEYIEENAPEIVRAVILPIVRDGGLGPIAKSIKIWLALQVRASASGLSRPGEGETAKSHGPYQDEIDCAWLGREWLEDLGKTLGRPSINNEQPTILTLWERDRLVALTTVVRDTMNYAHVVKVPFPARSTAPSVLTEEECNFLLVLCSMIRRAIGDDPADRLLAIKRRLTARAFPDSTKETK